MDHHNTNAHRVGFIAPAMPAGPSADPATLGTDASALADDLKKPPPNDEAPGWQAEGFRGQSRNEKTDCAFQTASEQLGDDGGEFFATPHAEAATDPPQVGEKGPDAIGTRPEGAAFQAAPPFGGYFVPAPIEGGGEFPATMEKTVRTWQAKFALAGWALTRTDTGAFIATRWGRATADLHGLAAVEGFAARVGAL